MKHSIRWPFIAALIVCLLRSGYFFYVLTQEYSVAHNCWCGGTVILRYKTVGEFLSTFHIREFVVLVLLIALSWLHPSIGVVVYAINWLQVGIGMSGFFGGRRNEYEIFKVNEGATLIFLGVFMIIGAVGLLIWWYVDRRQSDNSTVLAHQ